MSRENVMAAAKRLAMVEKSMAEEYLLRVAGGVNSFQAQKMAEAAFAQELREAQAEYQIAIAELRSLELEDTLGGTD